MNESLQEDIVTLGPTEAMGIGGGGGYMPIVLYWSGCFAAGFNFGYSELGPRIFG